MSNEHSTPNLISSVTAARGPSWPWAAAVIVAAGALVFVAGIQGKVVLGDECYHYMFAQAWTEAGPLDRPVHNPLYPSGEPPGYYYVTEPVWPMFLSLVWRATGVRQWAAQAYQAAFYILLLAMVYQLGRRFLGERGALAALLATVSVPMIGAFSVLLYVDVPATALVMAAVVLLLDRRWVWAGLIVGVAYLTKRNTFFLAPPLALCLICREGPFWPRVRRIGLFLAPMVLVVLPDWFWRRYSIPALSDPLNPAYIMQRALTFFSNQQLASNLNSPFQVLQYMGLAVPGLLGLYVARRAWRKGDGWLWVTIGVYLAALILFFTLDTDVRYVMPAAPLLVLVVTRALEGWWKKAWVLLLLGAVAFCQTGAAVWYVNRQRRLTPGQGAVFAYLRAETPEGTRVLYPGEVLMTEARRPVVWNHLIDPRTGKTCLPDLLVKYGPQEILTTLQANEVRYLCVDHSKILKGPLARTERGGYPQAFVDRLPTLPSLEKVPGDWPGIELWKVKQDDSETPGIPGAGAPPAPADAANTP